MKTDDQIKVDWKKWLEDNANRPLQYWNDDIADYFLNIIHGREKDNLEKLREYSALIPKEDRKGYDQCISDYMVRNQL